MARPHKQGVDYFPLDVHTDDKFKFIEIKYKLEGFAIVIKLLQKIYSYGYWYKWTDDEALLFSDELRVDYNLVANVVNECLKREVFDPNLYEKHKILTSKGIQKRYKEIVRRRKDVKVTPEYLLIDNIIGVNDVINPAEGRQSDNKSTQRKGNRNRNEIDIEKDIYLEFVKLTKSEHEKLLTDYGEKTTGEMIERLNDYIGSKGKKYKSHYHTIKSWIRKDEKQPNKGSLREEDFNFD